MPMPWSLLGYMHVIKVSLEDKCYYHFIFWVAAFTFFFFFALNIHRYGPFWICTTLIFVAASIGTFVTYVTHKLKKEQWNYDINLVTWSAGLFYGYVIIVPLCLYAILKYFSAPAGLVQLFCLYGYSLFVFIPALVSYCSSNFHLFWERTSRAIFIHSPWTFVLCSVCQLCHWTYSDGWLQGWLGSCQQHLWHSTFVPISCLQAKGGSLL